MFYKIGWFQLGMMMIKCFLDMLVRLFCFLKIGLGGGLGGGRGKRTRTEGGREG